MLKALLITIGFTLAAVQAVPFSPYAEDKCGECKANGTMLADFMRSDAGINAAVMNFNSDFCPYEANSAECKKNVTMLWPAMAKALFGDKDTVPQLCMNMKVCNKTKSEEMGRVGGVANAYVGGESVFFKGVANRVGGVANVLGSMNRLGGVANIDFLTEGVANRVKGVSNGARGMANLLKLK